MSLDTACMVALIVTPTSWAAFGVWLLVNSEIEPVLRGIRVVIEATAWAVAVLAGLALLQGLT